ncbi:MAG: hypothetical protein WA610_04785, partial [Thermodesulfovibrionales bacterium]
YLQWKKPETQEFKGVRIYRTSERQLGDFREVSQEQEIYDGFGFEKGIDLILPEIAKGIHPPLSMRSEGSLRFRGPSPRQKPDPSKVFPGAVHLDSVSRVRLTSDYYIDIPPEHQKTFTYIIYGYDNKGSMSYPVVVNAALAEPNAGVKTVDGSE